MPIMGGLFNLYVDSLTHKKIIRCLSLAASFDSTVTLSNDYSYNLYFNDQTVLGYVFFSDFFSSRIFNVELYGYRESSRVKNHIVYFPAAFFHSPIILIRLISSFSLFLNGWYFTIFLSFGYNDSQLLSL